MRNVHRTLVLIVSLLPFAPAQAAPSNLPETGQTTCTDTLGNVINCANTGMDGDVKAGVAWPSPRFVVDGTGNCVTDNLTGLMWGRAPGSTPQTWTNALANANGLTLCGFSDWRLPNINELESLVNIGTTSPATFLNSAGFSGVLATGDTGGGGGYWSSTSHASSASNAWLVYMIDGSMVAIAKSNLEFLLPVRGAK